MFHPRVALLAGALALGLTASGAAAAEVQAQPVCRKSCCASSSRYAPLSRCCYDPCECVGPIRRVLRRIFLPKCPPRVVAPAVAVVPPMVPPPGPPPGIGRPFVPPPGTGAVRREAPAFTPTAPPPVRLDRMASRANVQATVVSRASKPVPHGKVALIHAERANLRHQLAADAQGRIAANLEGGTWLVYSRDDNGRYVYRGKLTVREKETTRARLLGE